MIYIYAKHLCKNLTYDVSPSHRLPHSYDTLSRLSMELLRLAAYRSIIHKELELDYKSSITHCTDLCKEAERQGIE